ncbi:MAG: hypothetical protein JO276_00365 [Sphingomonadaceae bacterium]|nr:hypothetical protein [Sphingomonadaceae bacterium]
MRKLITVAMIAGAALAVSACKRQPTVNNITANDLSANMSMSAPANDASAMESVTNSAPPATNNLTNSAGNNSVADPGRGVSTNNVESNTVGM